VAPSASSGARGSASPKAKPAARLPKPPQGHGGYRRKVPRTPPRSSGPPRYETTNAKQRILTSALRLADERGYEALRISDITDPLGIQRQAFYAHFRDKRHCLSSALDPKLGAIVELASSKEEDPPRWAEHVICAVDEALQERFHSQDGTRGRLVASMIEMLRETESYDSIRIGKLIKRARVPTGDFYKQFSGKRECFAVAYEEMLGGLISEVREGMTSRPMLDVLGTSLAFDPIRVKLLVFEATQLPEGSTPEMAGAWRGSLVEAITELLVEDASTEDPRGLEVIAASLVEVIRGSLIDGSVDALPVRLQEVGEGFGLGASATSERTTLAA
jgi:AcrR family transcriptional regulator